MVVAIVYGVMLLRVYGFANVRVCERPSLFGHKIQQM